MPAESVRPDDESVRIPMPYLIHQFNSTVSDFITGILLVFCTENGIAVIGSKIDDDGGSLWQRVGTGDIAAGGRSAEPVIDIADTVRRVIIPAAPYTPSTESDGTTVRVQSIGNHGRVCVSLRHPCHPPF